MIANKEPAMPIRIRKLIGTVALLVLVSVWALLAMALAQSVLTDINGFVAAIFYAVAGLGWVLPAMPLISWMAKPDRAIKHSRAALTRRKPFHIAVAAPDISTFR